MFHRLFSKMSMWTDDDPRKIYPNSNAAWKKFESCFKPIYDLLRYVNVFEMYLWQAMTEFMKDNVQYMEIRGIHVLKQVSIHVVEHQQMQLTTSRRLTCIHVLRHYSRNSYSNFGRNAIFLESSGTRLGDPGQKALQTTIKPTLFVDFCLIPLSYTCSFVRPART